MDILDDPQTPLEKRCYDEKGNNIFKAPPIKKSVGMMQIRFNNALSVEIQGVIKLLTDNGYKITGGENYTGGPVYHFKM